MRAESKPARTRSHGISDTRLRPPFGQALRLYVSTDTQAETGSPSIPKIDIAAERQAAIKRIVRRDGLPTTLMLQQIQDFGIEASRIDLDREDVAVIERTDFGDTPQC